MKKKIIAFIIVVLCVIALGFGIYFVNNKDKVNEKNVLNATNEVTEENTVIVTEETQEIVNETIEATESGEDLSTTEEIESTHEEEQTLEEEDLEIDAQVEQENIAWEGDSTGNGLSLLGSYQGLTYYSQADSRWANVMYSSVNDSSQTMKSSACGPTSAAMVVSSSKGTILPTTMAQLAVSNGYRTVSSGTAWSYYSFVADYFDFEEYYSTSNFTTAMSYLKQDKDNNGVADYFIICSCGSGLFTSSGHYIVLIADNDGTITVYDPYLYSGKFTTSSRKAANVTVSGNSAYVTETNFKKYANYKNFWIFSNDEGAGNTVSTSSSNSTNTSKTVNYTRYVSTSSGNLNVRSSASTSSTILTSLAKGTKVTVTKVDGNWSYITSPTIGWVSSAYLSSTKVTTSSSSTTSTTTTRYVSVSSVLNVRKGAGTSYSIVKALTNGTKVTVYETKNGWSRIGTNQWVKSSYLSSSKPTTTSSSSSSTTTKYVNTGTSARLNVRKGAGTNYSIVKTLTNGTKVTVYETKGNWSRIGTNQWVKSSCLKSSTTSSSNTVGTTKTLKTKTTLYSKSSLTGTKYVYVAGTKVTVIKNISSKVDYVKVNKTGRYAYVSTSAYK